MRTGHAPKARTASDAGLLNADGEVLPLNAWALARKAHRAVARGAHLWPVGRTPRVRAAHETPWNVARQGPPLDKRVLTRKTPGPRRHACRALGAGPCTERPLRRVPWRTRRVRFRSLINAGSHAQGAQGRSGRCGPLAYWTYTKGAHRA